MSICFRVDASSSIGVGHLMRCLAFAQVMDEQMIEVSFFIRPHTRSICRSRHDWVGRLHIIPDEISFEEEPQWISDKLSVMDARLFILDGYQFYSQSRTVSHSQPPFQYCARLHALLKANTVPLALFDDTNSNGTLHADFIINAAPDATQLNYRDTAPSATLCLGSEHRVLRQEFYHQESISWVQRHSLTIVMGGSDVKNLTMPILAALASQAFTSPVRVLTTSAYPHSVALNQLITNSPLAIQHLVDCQNVAEIFSHSTLVLSAAGSTQFEILACGTPAILLTVADNQIPATQSAQQQGWCETLDCCVSLNREHTGGQNEQEELANRVAKEVMSLWQDQERLHALFTRAQQLQASHLNAKYTLLECLLNED